MVDEAGRCWVDDAAARNEMGQSLAIGESGYDEFVDYACFMTTTEGFIRLRASAACLLSDTGVLPVVERL